MSRLTLRLPETLHQQLAKVAEQEGVSLNQYIVYSLTRQTSLGSQLEKVNIDQEIERQQSSLESLKARLGEASSADIDAILTDRAVASCEPELTTETIDRLRQKLAIAKH